MRNEYQCDLCKKSVRETSWDRMSRPLHIETICTSQNPLGDLGYGYQYAKIILKEVCPECQFFISTALAKRIAVLTGRN
jgi:hypothetical protein